MLGYAQIDGAFKVEVEMTTVISNVEVFNSDRVLVAASEVLPAVSLNK